MDYKAKIQELLDMASEKQLKRLYIISLIHILGQKEVDMSNENTEKS